MIVYLVEVIHEEFQEWKLAAGISEWNYCECIVMVNAAAASTTHVEPACDGEMS